MIIYSIVMLLASVVLIIIGIMIYRGKTELIHAYHQTNVKDKDKTRYGKAMGKALICVSIPLIVSGVLAFFDSSLLITIVLIVGLIISFIPLILVQKKYNGGLF